MGARPLFGAIRAKVFFYQHPPKTKEENGYMEWYQKSQQQLVDELQTDASKGLTSAAASEKLAKFGPNQLEEGKKRSFAAKLLDQFKDPMVLILIVAAILSAITGDVIESLIIIAIVVINALLGLYQEGKAEASVEALQKMSSPNAKVIRNGEQVSIKSSEVVPGDVVILETGDIVPADLRLIESSNLQIDESSLTGESVAVDKDASVVYEGVMEIGDRENTAYSSTIVTYGRGKGIVVETGHGTEIGKIATTIASFENEETPLQRKLAQLSKVLGILVIVVCGIVFVAGFLRGMEILDIFMTAISLAVAAIPEGMTAVVTIVLSLGMNRMAGRHAIVKRLLSVETLGTTTVICSDKTGTLTQNEMTITKAYVNGKDINVTGTGYDPTGDLMLDGKAIKEDDVAGLHNLVCAAALANDAIIKLEEGQYKTLGDPTEGAMISFAGKVGYEKSDLEKDYPRVEEIPFDSTRKMMTTFHTNFTEGKFTAFTKGAPDIVIDRCTTILLDGQVVPFTDELKKQVLAKNSELAQQALRVMSYAFRIHDKLPADKEKTSEFVEKEMTFIGLTGMIDPARPEVQAAIAECKTAGINVIMITGDYLETAFAIGKELGITDDPNRAIMGRELNTMNEAQLREVVKTHNIFARVSPENKVQIVTALKENGEIAGMTGDGVNDAPAIKKADIGIAMGITGTDVAKNTADVILTDDNFATIVHAVEEGRIIYSNIKKFVSFLLSCNIGEVLIVFIAIMIGWPVPLSPIQLLWLNLVTDSFPALALGMEEGEEDIMQQKPRDPDEPIIDKSMQFNIAVQSIAIAACVLAAFYVGGRVFYADQTQLIHDVPYNVAAAQTFAFVTLITAELLRSFSVRSFKYTLAHIGFFTNKNLNKAVLASFSLMLIVMFVPAFRDLFNVIPMTLRDWGLCMVLAFLPLIAGEVAKVARSK